MKKQTKATIKRVQLTFFAKYGAFIEDALIREHYPKGEDVEDFINNDKAKLLAGLDETAKKQNLSETDLYVDCVYNLSTDAWAGYVPFFEQTVLEELLTHMLRDNMIIDLTSKYEEMAKQEKAIEKKDK